VQQTVTADGAALVAWDRCDDWEQCQVGMERQRQSLSWTLLDLLAPKHRDGHWREAFRVQRSVAMAGIRHRARQGSGCF
jgi:hypothetical protein